MVYSTNVPGWERVLRVMTGVALIAWGLWGMKGTIAGYVVAASGVAALLTGFIGFCPMCAMAGRKIDATLKQKAKEGA